MQTLLTVAYDGTNYSGWQRQQNAIAVQQRLEEALSALLNQPITTKASSRTDAGVHALGQRVAFFTEKISIPMEKLPQVINGFLPKDIAVTAAEVVPDEFNPRFDAKYKTYNYNIYNASIPNPLINRYSVHIPQPIDVEAMENALSMFIGRHDFAAFMATGGSAKTTVREIYDFSVVRQPSGLITLSVTGNGFLYNMVRIMAGTMLYIGLGKLPSYAVSDIILSLDRTKAGKTMPPEGLTLHEVGYTTYRQME
ncbi:MAG: tRNA pseudouridine(38-40) synthase TruA [Defluviitaleaceae bacterium]|nr:tRNA pseudouridine(38-40) synthase TruA [Defluviitaleaceae bacterium]